jgi:hypothetical protein
MISVTTEYYLRTYGGVNYGDDLTAYIKRATQMIDVLISVPPREGTEQETCYKNAICAQAENIGLCGGIEASLASGSGAGFTIGSFSMSGGSGADQSSSGSTGTVCGYARSWLEKGGLTYRGVRAL